MIVGQGDAENEIKEKIAKHSLNYKVKVLGVHSDVAKLMAGAVVDIMPYHHEAFPVTLVEAPVIGLQSIISDNMSKEIDLCLDVVNFLILKDNNDVWCDKIVKLHKGIKKIKNTLELLTDRGFDSKQTALELQNLYLGK
jgi:glycosyltransferase EpsF